MNLIVVGLEFPDEFTLFVCQIHTSPCEKTQYRTGLGRVGHLFALSAKGGIPHIRLRSANSPKRLLSLSTSEHSRPSQSSIGKVLIPEPSGHEKPVQMSAMNATQEERKAIGHIVRPEMITRTPRILGK